MKMIDIHCHLLPGVDDGASDVSESVEMCHRAAAAGCEALIATPHQRHPVWWNSETRRLAALLRRIRDQVGERPALYLGGEIRVDDRFLVDLDRLVSAGALSLAGSSYLLIEFPRQASSLDPLATVRQVVAAGWRPVIAHPEFVPALLEEPSLCHELVAAGALMQITAMSVTGGFGEPTRARVEALLDRGLAHFLASDAHGADNRPPGLRRARRLLARRWGEETADRLTRANPLAVLEDRPLPSTATLSTSGSSKLH